MKKTDFAAQRDNIIRLEENAARKTIPKLKVVGKMLTELKWASIASSATDASKIFAFGSAIVTNGILKSESQLGFLSDDFDRLAETTAEGLSQQGFSKRDDGTTRLLKKYIEIVFIGVIGLIHLATKPKESFKTEEESEITDRFAEQFKNELILRLFFCTDYPKDLFKELAESLGSTGKRLNIMVNALEASALLAAAMSLSTKEAVIDQVYLENIILRLKRCVRDLENDIAEPNSAGENENQIAIFKAFLRQATMAMEQQDMNSLTKVFSDFIETYGFSKELLMTDIRAIKRMFDNYEEAYSAMSQKRVIAGVDMIG